MVCCWYLSCVDTKHVTRVQELALSAFLNTCLVSTQLKYLYTVFTLDCCYSLPNATYLSHLQLKEAWYEMLKLCKSRESCSRLFTWQLYSYTVFPPYSRDYRHPGIGRIRKYVEPLPPPCGQRMSVTILTHQKPFWWFMQNLFKYLINIAQCSFFCSSEQ